MENNKFDLSFQKILTTENVASLLNEQQKTDLLSIVQENYRIDKEEGKGLAADAEEGVKMAMQIIDKEKEGEPNQFIPTTFKACMNYRSNALPAIFGDGNIAKIKVVGNDSDIIAKDDKNEDVKSETGEKVIAMKGGSKLKRALRVEKYFNYILQNKIDDFFTNKSLGLLVQSAAGSFYSKTYFNPLKKKLESKLIYPNCVIINPSAKNMEEYPMGEEIYYTQNEVYQKMKSGEFTEYKMEDIINDTSSAVSDSKSANAGPKFSENSKLIRCIVQQTVVDLDGDGYKEPYSVSFFPDSDKLMGIKKRFSDVDVERNGEDIISIEGYNPYDFYPFVRDIRGIWAGFGFGYILKKLNKGQNSSLNQLLYAGIRSNQDNGFFNQDAVNKNKDDELKVSNNTYKGVSLNPGYKMEDMIMNLPSKEPSQTLFNLLGFLVDTGKDASNLTTLGDGDFPANAAPGTVYAMVREEAKQFKAIYRDYYLSFTKELKKIFKIIVANPDAFAAEYKIVLDDEEADFEKDFSLENMDIVPAGDPEFIFDSEKTAKAGLLQSMVGVLPLNPRAVAKRILEYYSIEDADDLLMPDLPPPPDPMVEALKQEAETNRLKAQIANQESMRKAAEGLLKARETDDNSAKIESEIEKNKAITIKTLAEAEEKATSSTLQKLQFEAESLYEPTKEIENEQTTVQ